MAIAPYNQNNPSIEDSEPLDVVKKGLEILKSVSPEISEEDLSLIESETNPLNYRKLLGYRFIELIKSCNVGERVDNNNYPDIFENLCLNLIRLTFSSDFPSQEPRRHHYKSKPFGETSNIRDIYINNRPSDGKIDNFWNVIRVDGEVKCKKIVFECKNYDSKNLDDNEVLQLYNYLDPDSFGKLGIILCRGKEEKIGESALQAIFRVKKDGYVILVVNESAMVKWIEAWILTGSSEKYFSNLYDDYGINTAENALVRRVYTKTKRV